VNNRNRVIRHAAAESFFMVFSLRFAEQVVPGFGFSGSARDAFDFVMSM
jgi:hypothetical protein